MLSSTVRCLRTVNRRLLVQPRRGLASATGTSSFGSFEELNLKHDKDTNVLTVQFNRQHRLNALSFQMGEEILELCNVLRELPVGSDVRCVVVTGAGRAFSTGRDLKVSRCNGWPYALLYDAKCCSVHIVNVRRAVLRCVTPTCVQCTPPRLLLSLVVATTTTIQFPNFDALLCVDLFCRTMNNGFTSIPIPIPIPTGLAVPY